MEPPRVNLGSPWLFFCVVLSWSWLFWIPMAVLDISIQTSLGRGLELVGLLGPALGGIGLAYLTQNREGWRDYWSRVVDPRRIPLVWYPIILFFAPVLWTGAVLLDVLVGGSAAPELIGQRLDFFRSVPSSIAPFVLLVLVNGPVPEELGWRGYVLGRLQERRNVLISSLILGTVWALFHLPLFYIKDTFHADRGAWSAWFWLFMLQIVAASFIFTWIFNNTRHSTLAAILLHFAINLTAELVNRTERTNLFATLLWIVAAAVAAALMGVRTPPGDRRRLDARQPFAARSGSNPHAATSCANGQRGD